ncbi:MAG: class II fructose-bisphosphate aldolase [Candidatus Sungbacteria bacterium]|nr:class II fructose-bisphosphate aldolase [Candidatus Sungbacteria bacterium]
MKTLKEFLVDARQGHWATGHFNASELDHMRAIVEACKEVGSPAIIGASEGERKHLGLLETVALRDVFRNEFNIPVFLNADHTKSVDAAKQAIDAGFDSVHIDLSAKSFEENTVGTKEIVVYGRAKDSEINIEGELGYLRGESKIQHEKIAVSAQDYTKPEEAARFVEQTGVDRLAIAVGNIHGISLDEPDLDIERIRAIRAIVPEHVALVLHAASGIPDDQIRQAIDAGIANIHINTDLRVAFVSELKKSLAEHLDEAAMYKLDASAIEAMRTVIKSKLDLFGAIGRI